LGALRPDVIERHVDDPVLFECARVRFMNALPTAKRWLKCVHPDLELKRTWGGKHKLAAYCELICIRVPKKYGQNVAAKGIKAMREAIESHGSDLAITAEGKTAKEAWKAVLGHNRLDCQNAREIVTRAAAECSTT
jgi:hypothetical protein